MTRSCLTIDESKTRHVRQMNDMSCAHACIAMATGIELDYVWSKAPQRLDIHRTIQLLEFYGQHITRLDAPNDLCLLTVPSLNELGRNHMVMMDCKDGFEVFDPNMGRPHKKWYTMERMNDDLLRYPLHDWSEVLKVVPNEFS